MGPRRGGEGLDVDGLWDAARADLEAWDAQTIGSWRQLCVPPTPPGVLRDP
jgi:hypothetical protein